MCTEDEQYKIIYQLLALKYYKKEIQKKHQVRNNEDK